MAELDVQKLLHAIHLAQNEFIEEPDTRKAFRLILQDLLQLTQSEYGFIGEAQHRPGGGEPFLKIHAYTDIAWDETTRQLLIDCEESGLEFHNLDTLFGVVVRTGDVVISNEPAATRELEAFLPAIRNCEHFWDSVLFRWSHAGHDRASESPGRVQ